MVMLFDGNRGFPDLEAERVELKLLEAFSSPAWNSNRKPDGLSSPSVEMNFPSSPRTNRTGLSGTSGGDPNQSLQIPTTTTMKTRAARRRSLVPLPSGRGESW